MTSLLPIIEELAGAQNHAVRAQWLMAAPQSVLLRDQVDIRRLLTAAGFHEGLAYFDAEIAALSAVRGRDGLAPFTIRMLREHARIGVQVIARGGVPIDGKEGEGREADKL